MNLNTSMKVKVVAFGIAREICGARTFEVEVPTNCDTDALKQLLEIQYPRFHLLAPFQLAVNEAYVVENILLASGDEIAILPPVSGG
jgi:molybdopterin converting factor subunit 1